MNKIPWRNDVGVLNRTTISPAAVLVELSMCVPGDRNGWRGNVWNTAAPTGPGSCWRPPRTAAWAAPPRGWWRTEVGTPDGAPADRPCDIWHC